jgi:hypothetical protein
MPINKTFSTAIPPNSHFVIQSDAIVFSQLELNDGSVVEFSSKLKSVEITCIKLILHGASTFDLTPKISVPQKPAAQPEKEQAGNDSAPQDGARGLDGASGGDGVHGINLIFKVQELIAEDGSLWIKTDGTPGGSGGDGGAGGKGSSGPQTFASNPNGGNGGNGGTGGVGGKGGNTAKVILEIGPDTVSPQQADGVAPSARPSISNSPGIIVISGAPGAGGNGGKGGRGGDGGEGNQAHFPSPTSDSSNGEPGQDGVDGAKGNNGLFTP